MKIYKINEDMISKISTFIYKVLAFLFRPTHYDAIYLFFLYRVKTGSFLNLKNPKSFREKIQWLKIYNRNPLYTNLVDKYEVKKYVADIIGDNYIIPTLGVWEKTTDIDWDSLPDKFVLKTTHYGGGDGIIICKNKEMLNKAESIDILNSTLKKTLYTYHREWPYKDVHRRIIAEEYIEDFDNPDMDLIDYKFFCFNGQPVYCQVIRNRRSKETIDFYDMDWNLMPFVGLNPTVSNGATSVPKPLLLEEMKDIASKLSVDIPFSRIDLYIVNNNIFFSEITFFPASGFGAFNPKEWDLKLGSLIDLRAVMKDK